MKKCVLFITHWKAFSLLLIIYLKKKIGMQVTYVPVFRVNLRPALRFKWTSCKSMRKSLLKSCSYHICSPVYVRARIHMQHGSSFTADTDFNSVPFPSENHWLETEMGQENILPRVWIPHRRAWTLLWSPHWEWGAASAWGCKDVLLCCDSFQGHGLSVETLNIKIFV